MSSSPCCRPGHLGLVEAWRGWTPNVPTPPPAPLMRILCPRWIRPRSRRPCSASVAAAVSPLPLRRSSRSGSSRARLRERRHTREATQRPLEIPKTSSPGRSSSTFLPTASTRPATSDPRMYLLGLSSPNVMRFEKGCPAVSASPIIDRDGVHLDEDLVIGGIGCALPAGEGPVAVPYRVKTTAFIGLARGNTAGRPTEAQAPRSCGFAGGMSITTMPVFWPVST